MLYCISVLRLNSCEENGSMLDLRNYSDEYINPWSGVVKCLSSLLVDLGLRFYGVGAWVYPLPILLLFFLCEWVDFDSIFFSPPLRQFRRGELTRCYYSRFFWLNLILESFKCDRSIIRGSQHTMSKFPVSWLFASRMTIWDAKILQLAFLRKWWTYQIASFGMGALRFRTIFLGKFRGISHRGGGVMSLRRVIL
jgi:hypothetical protein